MRGLEWCHSHRIFHRCARDATQRNAARRDGRPTDRATVRAASGCAECDPRGARVQRRERARTESMRDAPPTWSAIEMAPRPRGTAPPPRSARRPLSPVSARTRCALALRHACVRTGARCGSSAARHPPVCSPSHPPRFVARALPRTASPARSLSSLSLRLSLSLSTLALSRLSRCICVRAQRSEAAKHPRRPRARHAQARRLWARARLHNPAAHLHARGAPPRRRAHSRLASCPLLILLACGEARAASVRGRALLRGPLDRSCCRARRASARTSAQLRGVQLRGVQLRGVRLRACAALHAAPAAAQFGPSAFRSATASPVYSRLTSTAPPVTRHRHRW
jgi:hypothetical protein